MLVMQVADTTLDPQSFGMLIDESLVMKLTPIHGVMFEDEMGLSRSVSGEGLRDIDHEGGDRPVLRLLNLKVIVNLQRHEVVVLEVVPRVLVHPTFVQERIGVASVTAEYPDLGLVK